MNINAAIKIFLKIIAPVRYIVEKIVYKFFLNRYNNWDLLEKYKNQTINVIANGPSLNKTNFKSFEGPCIGMNKINLIFEKKDWHPDMIVCINGLVISQNKEFFNKTEIVLLLPVKAFFLGIRKRKNIIFFNLKSENKFSLNFRSFVGVSATVTFTALQLSYFLNPIKVNIYGLDHNFKINDKPHKIEKLHGDDEFHFDPNYFKDQFWGLPDLRVSELGYELAKNIFKKNNIEILDCTVDGKCKVFKKQG